ASAPTGCRPTSSGRWTTTPRSATSFAAASRSCAPARPAPAPGALPAAPAVTDAWNEGRSRDAHSDDASHRDRRRRSLDRPLPAGYNTITPALRDELAAAIDDADADPAVHVILLRAEGPAFCAGYGLDWSTAAQATEEARERAWDSVTDVRMISRFVDTYLKLWYAKKPTIAAVQGWCIGGGTDMVLCADIVI